MARKRMIDPDSWTDEKLAELSVGAHLLWVGAVSLADDEGRIKWSARQLKIWLFPVKDEATTGAVQRWMDELVSAGAIVAYESEGKTFAYHPDWREQQYVNKPAPSAYPAPPGVTATVPSFAGWREATLDDLPPIPALYALYEGDQLVYVGQSGCLSSRLGSTHHVLHGLRRADVRLKIRCAPTDRAARMQREAKLIARLQPPKNRLIPVYGRISAFAGGDE